MATYSTDLEGLTPGAGVPSGFTSRWDAGTWSVVDSSGDNVCREASAGNNRYFISLNSVDGDADRANSEVLIRVRCSSFATGSMTFLGAMLRGAGNGSAETGYGVLIVNGSPTLRIARYSAGTNTMLADSATITASANTWYWIRARANGTAIKGRIWADGDSEPGTWNVETTDATISAAGWSGFFAFWGGGNKEFSDIAVATNGDTAAMAGPSGDISAAGAAQAGGTAGISALVGAAASGAAQASGTATLTGGAAGDIDAAGAAQASGTATVSVDVTLDADGSALASGTATAELQTITISDDYERSSVNVIGSSVTGVGDDALIVIKPRVQESEVKSSLTAWLEPSARVTAVNGYRPTFRFSDYAATWSDGKYHGTPWGSTRRPMFSYDRLTWTYFDTQVIGGSYIEFRHNTAFTSNTVYISRERQVSTRQLGEWIEALAAAHPTKVFPTASALAFTPSGALAGWPAQAFIADEFSPQTDELGRTIPATPFYAFEINDESLTPPGGVKRLGVMSAGVHAGEDTGTWAMMRSTEAMLGGSASALYARQHFRMPHYGGMNPPGRDGGGWRGSFTQGTAGADDANRHANESGSGLEIVDKPKSAMVIDWAGETPAWAFDWHGQFGAPWSSFTDTPAMIAFASVLSAKFGTTVTDAGDLVDAGFSEYWRINKGVALSMTLEFGNNIPVSDAEYVNFGTAFVESVEYYFQALAAPGVAQASGTAALSAQVSISVDGITVADGSAGLQAAVPLVATGLVVADGTAGATASVSVSALGLAQAAASAGLSASVLLAGAGAAQASGNATLTAILETLAAGAALASGTAQLSGGAAGDISASGQAAASGSGALTVTVSLSAAGSAQASGTASGTASSLTLTAAGFVRAMGTGVLSVDVDLAAAGFTQATGTAAATLVAAIPDQPALFEPSLSRVTQFSGSIRRTVNFRASYG